MPRAGTRTVPVFSATAEFLWFRHVGQCGYAPTAPYFAGYRCGLPSAAAAAFWPGSSSLASLLGWAHGHIFPMLLVPGLNKRLPEHMVPVWLVGMLHVRFLPWLADVTAQVPVDFILPVLLWCALLVRLLASGNRRDQSEPASPQAA